MSSIRSSASPEGANHFTFSLQRGARKKYFTTFASNHLQEGKEKAGARFLQKMQKNASGTGFRCPM
jgi:hypothetical protein